jgi:lactoylglutathione lyase
MTRAREALKFSYTGIEVKDMNESIRFYTEVIGMRLLDRHRIPETGGEVAALQSGGSNQFLELNYYPGSIREYAAGDSLDHLAFEVDSVDGEMKRLNSLGYKIARPRETRTKFIVGFVEDPNGIWLELFQPRK